MSQRKPCCEDFNHTAVIYQDETRPLRNRLITLSELMIFADRGAAFDTETIVGIGEILREIWERHSVIDHILFGAPLPECFLTEDLRAFSKKLCR
ncbi:MAG: hypothetical protein AB7F66_14585 [Bacteriovoracia bacterium]